MRQQFKLVFCKKTQACFARFSTFSSKLQKYVLLHIVTMNEHGWIFFPDIAVVLIDKFWKMISHTSIWPQVTVLIWISRINKIILLYIKIMFVQNLIPITDQKENYSKIINTPIFYFSISFGGFRNFIFELSITSRNILALCALLFHATQTNINCMSKLHATIIFWVGTSFLPINGIWFSCDTQARTCISSIAPIQFYIKKIV
jgi:hypothetical protein